MNEDRYELLTRLDERVRILIGKFDGMEKRFVLRAEFEPVRNVVYGVVIAMLAGVMSALLALVLKG